MQDCNKDVYYKTLGNHVQEGNLTIPLKLRHVILHCQEITKKTNPKVG